MREASVAVKPTHKAVKDYYAALAAYDGQGVKHETAVRSAFQNLLSQTAEKARKWSLIPELGDHAVGSRIVPDGTLRDPFRMPRGYWEAKDTDDDLSTEIAKKIRKGYPTNNIIFEDTQEGVLFQNAQEVMRVNLRDAQALCDLLNRFLAYSEPNIAEFEKAVEAFKERVPELAVGLMERIHQAHKDNIPFQKAFAGFFDLCSTALNPNISEAAVDEMLIQHLLTERLFRTIFDNPEFARRNVIAVEVEKVISALVSKSFNRGDFFKALDRFYVAIEDAARALADFSDKQHFLNTVYERFFQGYSVKIADTHGIVYTPQPIVDFMCASVAELLEREFGLTVGSKGVNILDPCTGTGNFIVNLMRRIPKRDLPRMYREQLFANEVMLLPYYIAGLNIEHAYYELTGEYEPFEGLCFVDTLDMAEHAQASFPFMTQANTARVRRQKKTPITVILGNPPYNVGQINENDNNKNRKYAVIDKQIRDTYARDSTATNKNKLSDPYVKFFRWALDRLGGRDGIVCFVSNNSFVHKLAFDGMRKHLMQDFSRIYHVDLDGNVRDNPKLSGTTHNVFGIQVGVGITVAVRKQTHKTSSLYYAEVLQSLRRQEKCSWLVDHHNISGVHWQELTPDSQHTWIIPKNAEDLSSFPSLGSKEAKQSRRPDAEVVFKTMSNGIQTNRDAWLCDFSREALAERTPRLIETYNSEIDRWKRSGRPEDIDAFVNADSTSIKWCSRLKETLAREMYTEYHDDRIRKLLYRPFAVQFVYFDHILVHRQSVFPRIFPVAPTEQKNRVIALPGLGDRKGFACLVSDKIVSLDLAFEKTQCFPFYVYNPEGGNRRENITDWALTQFRQHYSNSKITKWDIFYYVYGLLHHPGYRAKYADCLKRELPRIPFGPDFWAFARAGKELAKWHLEYEEVEPHKLDWIETPDLPLSYRLDDKMRLNKERTALKVNASLTLAGIPAQVFGYRLGNRSALEWVIDQYRVKTDKRSGITSDPNRPDDPEYIVRLVGQVIRVSLETVRIVNSLPEDFGG